MGPSRDRRRIALVTHALANAPIGPYQVQAAIAAVHAESNVAEDTDWPQIVALYRVPRSDRAEPGRHYLQGRAAAPGHRTVDR